MRIMCAWCGVEEKEKEPFDDVSITHTICSECAIRWKTEIKSVVEESQFNQAGLVIQDIKKANDKVSD